MELKDVILSTLAEMEDNTPVENIEKPTKSTLIKPKEEKQVIDTMQEDLDISDEYALDNEMMFLTSMRERLLVLFEGFQAPNNTNIEAKVDMTLNFLEYVLVSIDTRVQKLEKESK